MTVAERVALCRQHGVSRQLFHVRVQTGWSHERAASTPPRAEWASSRSRFNRRHTGAVYEVGAFCLTLREWAALTGIPEPRLRQRRNAGRAARDVLRAARLPRGRPSLGRPVR